MRQYSTTQLARSPGRPLPTRGDDLAHHDRYGMRGAARRVARKVDPGLALSQPGDAMETEADRVAAQVMAGADPVAVSTGGGVAEVGRACCDSCACDDEPELVVQREADGAAPTSSAPAGLMAGLGGGRGLDHGVRGFMEQRFDRDFGDVRVHAGGGADAAARSVDALAFTVGNEVVFRDGAYQPDSATGRELIAHELTHTVQQRGVGRRVQRSVMLEVPPDLGKLGGEGFKPWFEPMPPDVTPKLEPMPLPPQMTPLPEVGPMPPAPGPGPAPAPAPMPFPEFLPWGDPFPWVLPQPQPQPQPPDDQPDPDCGSPQLPLTMVSFSPGPAGQGGSVLAQPLTKCPGNTRGSEPSGSIYREQFDCIAAAGEKDYWVRAHLLHGKTSGVGGAQNLHGPGNLMANLIITDKRLNGKMSSRAERPARNLVYGPGRAVLWYESKVDAYVPGLDYFAESITVDFGLFDPIAGTRGSRIGGGTFSREKDPPWCPSLHSEPGVVPPESETPKATSDLAFESTFKICLEGMTSRPFDVPNGGLEVTLDPRWTDPSGMEKDSCKNLPFLLYLERDWWAGWEEISATVVMSGSGPQVLRWRNLWHGTYRLRWESFNDDPSCCLYGEVNVGTFDAPRPKPGEPPTA